MDPYPDKEEMKDKRLNDKRERHCSMFFCDNEGGVYNDKYILCDKRWDVHTNN